MGKVMKKETLSNNIEYQEILREGRMEYDERCRLEDMKELKVLEQESIQFQQQVSMIWNDVEVPCSLICVVCM